MKVVALIMIASCSKAAEDPLRVTCAAQLVNAQRCEPELLLSGATDEQRVNACETYGHCRDNR